MPIKKRMVDRNLTKKGFVKDVKHDHIIYTYRDQTTGNGTRIRTKMSHNDRDLGDGLIEQMSEQLHLSKDDFLSFIQCHINRTQYDEMMIDKGLI